MVKMKDTGLTLGSSAYEAIRADIMEGKFEPGEKLQFDALRERYGIGISPIREALSRLHSEGWVAREEQRGFRVAEISKNELLDVVKTRVLIEGIAVTEGIAEQDIAAEEALVLAFHRLSKEHRHLDGKTRNPEWEKRHRQFHMALISGCKMKWITQFCEQLFDVAERYRLLSAARHPERSEMDEHRAILDAYIAGNADEVKRLLALHYQVTVDIILQAQFPSSPLLASA
jgi:GntR family transcriptional regulator, carbon starvation induced regulator